MMKKIFVLFVGLFLFLTPAYVYAEGDEPTTGTENNENTGENNNEEHVDNTLSSLTITGGTLSPEFNKTTYEYTITDVNPEKFKVDYTSNTIAVMDPSSGKLDDIIKKENKTFTITTTYTDSNNEQHTNTYKIRVDYEPPVKSSDLKSLSITGFQLDKKFDKDTHVYNLEIPHDVTTVTILAVAEDESAKITYNDSASNIIKDIKVGDENHIRIVVKNGNVSNIYTLNIIRKNDVEAKPNEEETTTDEENNDENEVDTEIKDDNKKEENAPGPKENVPDPNPILNRVIVTLASLIGIAIGSLGIYFYVITSPKHMKKEILKYRNSKKDASNNESLENENKKIEVKDDLVQTKEFKVNNNE